MNSEKHTTEVETNAASADKPNKPKQSKIKNEGPTFLPGFLVIIFGIGMIVWVISSYDDWIAGIQHTLWIKTQLLTSHFKNWIWRNF